MEFFVSPTLCRSSHDTSAPPQWRDVHPLMQAAERFEPKPAAIAAGGGADAFAKKRRVGSQLEQLGWAESEDEELAIAEAAAEKSRRTGQRIAILKHAFTIAQAEADGPEGEAEFYAQLQAELAEECAKKAGAVEKCTVFERSPVGAVALKFAAPRAAEKVLEAAAC